MKKCIVLILLFLFLGSGLDAQERTFKVRELPGKAIKKQKADSKTAKNNTKQKQAPKTATDKQKQTTKPATNKQKGTADLQRINQQNSNQRKEMQQLIIKAEEKIELGNSEIATKIADLEKKLKANEIAESSFQASMRRVDHAKKVLQELQADVNRVKKILSTSSN